MASTSLNIFSDLLQVIEKSRQECIMKRWGYTRNSEQIEDMAVQYDSVHAAFPWTDIRFLL